MSDPTPTGTTDADPVAARSGSRRMLVALVLLYGGQFLATGVIFALPTVLRGEGASLGQVGLISLVNFGIVAKMLWAPLVDRYGRLRRFGHYRSWLVVIQPAIAVCLLAMTTLEPRADFVWLFAGSWVLSALIGTQDIATDAIAVRMTLLRGRGAANAVQVAAGFGGAIVGTTTTLVVVQHAGWPAAAATVAGLSLLPLLGVRLLREPPAPPTDGIDPRRRPGFSSVLSLLREPGVARWMTVIVPLTWIGIVLPQSVLGPLLVDQGWRLDQLSLLTSTLTGAAGIAGAVAAGALVRRWGRRRVLLVAATAQLVATLGVLPMTAGAGGTTAVVTVIALGVARGITNTVIFTVSMDLTRDATAGSDYTILTTWGFGLAIVATSLGPVIAGAAGYAVVVVVALVLSLAALASVVTLFAERRSSTGDPEHGDGQPPELPTHPRRATR